MTSSTDRDRHTAGTVVSGAPDGLVVHDNLLDNISSISAELQSLTSQNISSVSRLKTPGNIRPYSCVYIYNGSPSS